MAYFY